MIIFFFHPFIYIYTYDLLNTESAGLGDAQGLSISAGLYGLPYLVAFICELDLKNQRMNPQDRLQNQDTNPPEEYICLCTIVHL